MKKSTRKPGLYISIPKNFWKIFLMKKIPPFLALLEHESLLSPFGKHVLENLVKHVSKDVSHNIQSSQQINMGPLNKKRRTLNFKSSIPENSMTPNNENTFDLRSSLNNINLSTIHEEDENNIHTDTNEVAPDSIKFVIEFKNRDLMLNMDSNKETCKGDSKAAPNVTWNNMFDTELFKPTGLETSNNLMDVDTNAGLNVRNSPLDGNRTDLKKCENKLSEINKVFDPVIDNFDPKVVLNCFSTWQDKEDTTNYKEKNTINDALRTTGVVNNTIPIYIDESANDFSSFFGHNNVESDSSALNDYKTIYFVEKNNALKKHEITDSNWALIVTKDIKTQAMPKKRLTQTKLTDIIAKKVKKDKNTDKNMFRKQKYTKTIKNWLNDVNINNAMKQKNEVENTGIHVVAMDNKKEVTENPENRKVRKKVHSQTQLANKGGVMKFK